MKDDVSIGAILAADLLQLVVIAIAITILIFLRAACGRQARFLVHLAIGYGGIGAFYLFDIVARSFAAITQKEMPGEMFEMVGSTLSLLNTAFFLTAWYLMRDLRFERLVEPEEPVPTMSKPFAASVIGALVGGIAGYIMMADAMAKNDNLRVLFVGIEAALSMGVLILIGFEFALLPLIRDAEEGSLFRSNYSHLVFRCITFLFFGSWAILQWGRLIWIVSDPKWEIVTPYVGQWYQWSAVFKILCAGCAGILALHALPSVRWKHRDVRPKAT